MFAINATGFLTDAQLAEICPGCGKTGRTHSPACPVAVRLHAGDYVAQYGAAWKNAVATAKQDTLACPCPYQQELFSHYTAVENCICAESPVAIVWDASEGVFYEFHTSLPFSKIIPPPARPEWWGKT